jgi:hypothetical protein
LGGVVTSLVDPLFDAAAAPKIRAADRMIAQTQLFNVRVDAHERSAAAIIAVMAGEF